MKVSVIVPVYNNEQYIERCLNSIQNQSYKNLEVIVINDGSKDNTKIKLQKYNDDTRFTIVNKSNEGVSKARNLGLEKASGDYITFVDSDDWIEKDTYLSVIEEIKNNKNNDIVSFNYKTTLEEIKKNEEDILSEKTSKAVLSEKINIENFFLEGEISPYIWDKVFKSEILNGIKFDENLNFGEDQKFIFRVLKLSKRYTKINVVKYFYFYNENGVTKKPKLKHIKDYIKVVKYIADRVEVENKGSFIFYKSRRNLRIFRLCNIIREKKSYRELNLELKELYILFKLKKHKSLLLGLAVKVCPELLSLYDRKIKKEYV